MGQLIRPHRRRWVPPTIAAAILALGSAGAALAAPGALTAQGCISDNDTVVEPCGDSTDGLNSVTYVAVSPDGQSVYTTAGLDDAIARFDRNPATGALTPQGCIEDNDFGPDVCGGSTDGLENARDVAI